ncbi:hypothetical protein [Streptomyces sp. NPDC003015]
MRSVRGGTWAAIWVRGAGSPLGDTFVQADARTVSVLGRPHR